MDIHPDIHPDVREVGRNRMSGFLSQPILGDIKIKKDHLTLLSYYWVPGQILYII